MRAIMMKFLLAIIVLVVIVWFNRKSDVTTKYNEQLTNKIKFSGIITYINTSANHNFSIIGIKLEDTNTAYFSDSIETLIAPFRIKDGYAEIYRTIPSHAEIGVKVVVDADKRKIGFYKNGQLVNEADIRYSNDPFNYRFVEINSRLK